jgi:hypothetical protein
MQRSASLEGVAFGIDATPLLLADQTDEYVGKAHPRTT